VLGVGGGRLQRAPQPRIRCVSLPVEMWLSSCARAHTLVVGIGPCRHDVRSDSGSCAAGGARASGCDVALCQRLQEVGGWYGLLSTASTPLASTSRGSVTRPSRWPAGSARSASGFRTASARSSVHPRAHAHVETRRPNCSSASLASASSPNRRPDQVAGRFQHADHPLVIIARRPPPERAGDALKPASAGHDGVSASPRISRKVIRKVVPVTGAECTSICLRAARRFRTPSPDPGGPLRLCV